MPATLVNLVNVAPEGHLGSRAASGALEFFGDRSTDRLSTTLLDPMSSENTNLDLNRQTDTNMQLSVRIGTYATPFSSIRPDQKAPRTRGRDLDFIDSSEEFEFWHFRRFCSLRIRDRGSCCVSPVLRNSERAAFFSRNSVSRCDHAIPRSRRRVESPCIRA